MRLDLYYSVGTAPYQLKWCLDGVEQAVATSQGGLSATTLAAARFGGSDAVTVDASYDDVLVSVGVPGDYPVGAGRGVLLKVDPAGVLTVSGSTANFNTYSANGTMAAWDATAARGAID